MGGDAEPAVPSSSDERRSVEDRFEDPVPFDELLRRASER
jgi:hypothetical protein